MGTLGEEIKKKKCISQWLSTREKKGNAEEKV